MNAAEMMPCPFCGGAAKMIHPMGNWVSSEIGYGPDGSRVVCTGERCCAMTWSFHGPDQDAQAIAAWNTRSPPSEASERTKL